MTNPPEITEHRTDTQKLGDDIATAVRLIRDAWEDTLPTGTPAQRISGGGRGGGVLAADDAKTSADIDPVTRALSARRHAVDILNSWSQLVMEDRPVTNPKSLPNGRDAAAMCDFLERQASWLSGHDAGTDALRELKEVAQELGSLQPPKMTRDEYLTSRPPVRWFIGRCPLPQPSNDAQPQPEPEEPAICDGRVYAYPDDEEGRELNQYERRRDPWAVCQKCGDRNVASVWERTIFPAIEVEGVAAERLVGIDRVVELAASQFGRHISKQAVWQWVARGKLAPIDREAKPHQFRLSDVIDTLTEREAG